MERRQAMEKLFVGVDVGKTNIRVGIAGDAPSLTYYFKQPHESSTPDGMEACMIRAIDEALGKCGCGAGSVAGIGIAFPAIVDRADGTVLYGPAFDFMSGRSVTRFVAARYGVPVAAEVDPLMATYGEHWAGAGRECRNFAVITWGTGIGAGLIIDGKVREGEDNLFPEFGHSVVSDDDWLCKCGRRGCLDALASGPGIARHGGNAVREGKPTLLREMSGGDPDRVTAAMVFEAAERGDKAALAILERVGVLLGRLCANLVYTFQPERIVVAGGLAEREKHGVLDAMTRTMNENCWLIARGFTTCRIEFSKLGDKAGVLGAIRKIRLKLDEEG